MTTFDGWSIEDLRAEKDRLEDECERLDEAHAAIMEPIEQRLDALRLEMCNRERAVDLKELQRTYNELSHRPQPEYAPLYVNQFMGPPDTPCEEVKLSDFTAESMALPHEIGGELFQPCSLSLILHHASGAWITHETELKYEHKASDEVVARIAKLIANAKAVSTASACECGAKTTGYRIHQAPPPIKKVTYYYYAHPPGQTP